MNRSMMLTSLFVTTLQAFSLSCSPSEVSTVTIPPVDEVPGSEYTVPLGRGNSEGFILYDIESKKVITSHNRALGHIPASTTKLLTAAASLDVLGPEYRFTTTVGKTGSVRSRVLHGNLYLKGGGDPDLSVDHLLGLIYTLKEEGIERVGGRFIYDESLFETRKEIDFLMDDDQIYNTGISSLSLDNNRIYGRWALNRKKSKKKWVRRRRWRPGRLKIVKPAFDLTLTPSLPGFSIDTTTQEGSDSETFRYEYRNQEETWLLYEKQKKNRGTSILPVKDPGLYTAQFFRKLCAIHRISLPEPEKGVMPGHASVVAEHRSVPVITQVKTLLTYSNNLTAELLLLQSAGKSCGRRTMSDSAEWLRNYWRTRVPGVDWKNINLVNGSGLSSKNLITPEQMLAVLLTQNKKKYSGIPFYSLLPLSGWQWSLVSRLNDEETAFHVRAKTGTLNYATALAGLIHGASGKRYLFVFFIDNKAARRRFDRIGDKRSKAEQYKASLWTARMRSVIDKTITRWIREL